MENVTFESLSFTDTKIPSVTKQRSEGYSSNGAKPNDVSSPLHTFIL